MVQFTTHKRASDEKELLKLKSGLNNNYSPKWRSLVVPLPRPRSGEGYIPLATDTEVYNCFSIF